MTQWKTSKKNPVKLPNSRRRTIYCSCVARVWLQCFRKLVFPSFYVVLSLKKKQNTPTWEHFSESLLLSGSEHRRHVTGHQNATKVFCNSNSELSPLQLVVTHKYKRFNRTYFPGLSFLRVQQRWRGTGKAQEQYANRGEASVSWEAMSEPMLFKLRNTTLPGPSKPSVLKYSCSYIPLLRLCRAIKVTRRFVLNRYSSLLW